MLVAVAPHRETGMQGLREAEAALRRVEGLMSAWIADSEISRLKAAGAGKEVELSAETLDVLRAARQAALDSDGAFDVTCRPLIELWRAAGDRGSGPSEAEIRKARDRCGWDHFDLTGRGLIKRTAEARVDLGGIAKGYGIDLAVLALQQSGASGGLVDVGGDLRCFGESEEGAYWVVELKRPFGDGMLARLRVKDAAVCTSGNYARFVEIAGRRYSHIIDPRSGRPAKAVPSATVLAPSAMTADIWATALSVLGEEGFSLLPRQVEAMIVLGSAEDHRAICTPGFGDMIEGVEPPELAIEERDYPASNVTPAAGVG